MSTTCAVARPSIGQPPGHIARIILAVVRRKNKGPAAAGLARASRTTRISSLTRVASQDKVDSFRCLTCTGRFVVEIRRTQRTGEHSHGADRDRIDWLHGHKSLSRNGVVVSCYWIATCVTRKSCKTLPAKGLAQGLAGICG